MDEQTRNQLRIQPKATISSSEFVSTGSTLLNVAISNNAEGGIAKGMYVFFVGDSASGKTWLALSIFAEAAKNPNFNDYVFIYDDAENAAFMDMETYFGRKAASRIKAPRYNGAEPIFSETVEDFYDTLQKMLESGKKIIWVEDSMDVLTTDADRKKLDSQMKAREKARKKADKGEGDGEADVAGSYGTAKAKINSERLREIVPLLAQTGSILVIISQTRDKIETGPAWMQKFNTGDKKTRAGGHALRFYAEVEVWTSQRSQIKEKYKEAVNDQNIIIGSITTAEVKKNKVTGRIRKVDIPIYYSFGIDDVGGCVDYLVEWGWWAKESGYIEAKALDLRGRRDDLIKEIEQQGLEPDLRKEVQKCFLYVEQQMALDRKPRYE